LEIDVKRLWEENDDLKFRWGFSYGYKFLPADMS
jgi:hypothetical protein